MALYAILLLLLTTTSCCYGQTDSTVAVDAADDDPMAMCPSPIDECDVTDILACIEGSQQIMCDPSDWDEEPGPFYCTYLQEEKACFDQLDCDAGEHQERLEATLASFTSQGICDNTASTDDCSLSKILQTCTEYAMLTLKAPYGTPCIAVLRNMECQYKEADACGLTLPYDIRETDEWLMLLNGACCYQCTGFEDEAEEYRIDNPDDSCEC